MVNLQRFKEDFCAIAQIGVLDNGGVTRLALSREDHEARNYLIEKMRLARLQVNIDPVGNIHGRRNGSNPQLPPVIIGSHMDTVPHGGHYDGVLGVLAGLEVVRTLNDSDVTTLHPIEVINFCAEESSRFGMATIGSKALTGKLSLDQLGKLHDNNDEKLLDILRNSGCPVEELPDAILTGEDVHAYLELHIEQGPTLENKQLDIGIVIAIAAPSRFRVQVIGRSDHSGNTPMDMRRDALAGAAEMVLAVERLAIAADNDLVGTVGVLSVEHGAMNVVPGEVNLSIDIRDTNMDTKSRLVAQLKKQLQQIADNRKLAIEITTICDEMPVTLDDKLSQLLCAQAEKLDMSCQYMPSGAGHDAMHFASLAPTGLIFIPSIDGISHNIAEKSSLDDINNGITLLLQAVLNLTNGDC